MDMSLNIFDSIDEILLFSGDFNFPLPSLNKEESCQNFTSQKQDISPKNPEEEVPEIRGSTE
jgi:hypothetical protein